MASRRRIVFETEAENDMKKLDDAVAVRIAQKLDWFASQIQPLAFAKPIKDSSPLLYRFRIGDYRVIFDYDDSMIIVLRVGHRSAIYR